MGERKDPPKDLYTVLGLQGGLDGGAYASSAQIRSAYRSRSLQCHPDKRPSDQAAAAAAEFQTLQDAYQVLTDESKRERYDSELYSSILRGPIQPAPKRKKKKSQVSGLAGLAVRKPPIGKAAATASSSKIVIPLEEVARIKAASGISGEACERTVCAAWDCSDGYHEAKLRETLALFGPIERVVAPEKKCRKGSGVVVFKFRASASGAVAGFGSDPELRLQMSG